MKKKSSIWIYKIKIICAWILLFYFPGVAAATEEWLQVPGVIHVQTSFDGTGNYSLDQLVSMAKEKGIEVLITADHDLQVMEYGLFPFRNIIRKREERDSVIKIGPDKFLDQISQVNRAQKSVVVIPGVQSSPFYYWSGSLLNKDLTAHNYRKELLLIGMQRPEDYQNLPLLHNGLSTRYTKRMLPRSLIFMSGLLLAVYIIMHEGIFRILGGITLIISAGLLLNHHPFQSSLFDPYHGDQGIKPYQEIIDYVNARNGHVIWLHPESGFAAKGVKLGPVKFITKHYPDDLIRSNGYSGFEAIYGDNITAIDPGKHWDIILKAYCQGDRASPAWGVSGADYHGNEGEDIDKFQTVFLTRKKTAKAILEALTSGRLYAVLRGSGPRLSLDQFQVKDDETGSMAIAGQEFDLKGLPLLAIKLSTPDNGQYPVKVNLIRGGDIMASFEGKTPLEIHFVDEEYQTGKTYYRLDVQSSSLGRLLSNPIFVSRK